MTNGDAGGNDTAVGRAELILRTYAGKDRIQFGQIQTPVLNDSFGT